MIVNVVSAEELKPLMDKMDKIDSKLDLICEKGMTGKELLTIKDVCKLLNLSIRTLQRYRDEGKISFSQVGSKIYFTREDIQTLLDNYKVKSFGTHGMFNKN